MHIIKYTFKNKETDQYSGSLLITFSSPLRVNHYPKFLAFLCSFTKYTYNPENVLFLWPVLVLYVSGIIHMYSFAVFFFFLYQLSFTGWCMLVSVAEVC